MGDTLAKALSALPDMAVVGVAASLAQVRSLIAANHPDIVVADAELGDEWALELPRELGPAGPRVLFLSGHTRPAGIALRNGAAGYVFKTEPFEELAAALRAVARGRTVFPLDALAEPPRPPSQREREVLGRVVQGASNKEIAVALHIEERTVESHLRRLFDRYGISNRTELAVLALKESWVDGAD